MTCNHCGVEWATVPADWSGNLGDSIRIVCNTSSRYCSIAAYRPSYQPSSYQSTMNTRMLLSLGLLVAIGVETEARSPFGRMRSSRAPAPPQTRIPSAAPQLSPALLNNAAEMTKRFGPSILIRDQSAEASTGAFAQQPH